MYTVTNLQFVELLDYLPSLLGLPFSLPTPCLSHPGRT